MWKCGPLFVWGITGVSYMQLGNLAEHFARIFCGLQGKSAFPYGSISIQLRICVISGEGLQMAMHRKL